VNWFWNPNAKWQFNYVLTVRDAPAAVGNAGDGTIHGVGMRFAHDF
jgi:phosphate-selective porin